MSEQNNLAHRFEEYINESRFCSSLSPKTILGYTAVFDLFLKLMPEITDVDLLTSDMIVEFFKRLKMRERKVGRNSIRVGVKNSTIKTYWSKLSSFFTWLDRKGIIVENPFHRIKPPQAIYEDSRALTDDDIRKLYAAIVLHSRNTFILRRDTAMLSLLLFCGLRLNEFISLEIRDIDFAKRLIIVRGNTSKSKRPRYIPIHPTLLFHLNEYIVERKKENLKTQYLLAVFDHDRELSGHGLKHWVKSLNKKSGVKFHLHQFRHSFACNLAKKNVNAIKIQKLLGHNSLNMTMTYLRSLETNDLLEDIEKLSFL